MHIVPMYTPRVCLRMIAYHRVDTPSVPRTGYQGRLGVSSSVANPAAASCLWVAT